jgi:hypothetical protein
MLLCESQSGLRIAARALQPTAAEQAWLGSNGSPDND